MKHPDTLGPPPRDEQPRDEQPHDEQSPREQINGEQLSSAQVSSAQAAIANPDKTALDRERRELLQQLEAWLETPMLVLGFIWLALLVAEFVGERHPLLEVAFTVIWVIFGLDFALRFALAPHKPDYLKRNWLTALSLLAPALRVFRVARALRLLRLARVTRGLRLFRLLSSLNRGMKALGASMGRRGFGYVVALTVIVTLAGAAGMYAFESEAGGAKGANGFADFGAALWWTAMLMTTLGSEAWPQSGEGRLLCCFLALYAFAVFGYVTATLATFFVGRDAENAEAEVASAAAVESLRQEIAALRQEIAQLSPANLSGESKTAAPRNGDTTP